MIKVEHVLCYAETDSPLGRRYFRRLGVVVDGKIPPISAGRLDHIAVFRTDKGYSILSYNLRYRYAGVELFDLNGVLVDSVFYQGEELVKVTGPQGLDQSDLSLVLLLSDRV